MKYQFYLDNVLIADAPIGWEAMLNNIQRREEVNGLFITLDANLAFWGDGYTVLKNKFDSSFCESCSLTINESCDDGISFQTMHEGIVFISSCEFLLNFCIAPAKVEDNSFYSKIWNNKSLKTNLENGVSKNGVVFTPPDDYQVSVFNPCDGTYYAAPRTPHTIRVFEAFRVLVAFMTDDTVDFESTFFDVGGEGEGYTITDGLHLSSLISGQYSAATKIQKINFIDLFTEMKKKFNLGMMIDNSGVRPKLIIEQDSFFKNNNSILTLNNIANLKASVFTEKLYAQVRFGGDSVLGSGCPAPGLAFPVDSIYNTTKEETFPILGICNIDSTLDLYSSWIIDSNIIQDLVVNGSEDYDDRIVILQTIYSSPGVGIATAQSPFAPFAGSPVFYNVQLLNSAVGERFLGGVPNAIADILNNVTDEVLVLRSQTNSGPVVNDNNPAVFDPLVFNDKTTPPYFDTGGNFTLATGRYTAPAGGLYKFNYTGIVSFSTIMGTFYGLEAKVIFRQFDATNVQIGVDDAVITNIGFESAIDKTVNATSKLFVLSGTDYVAVTIELKIINFVDESAADVFVKSGVFSTVYTSNGGGTLTAYDPAAYPVYKFEFEYPLTRAEYDIIKNQPNYAITINIAEPSAAVFAGNSYVAASSSWNVFIEQCKYNRFTAKANFTCFASKDQLTA